MINRPIVNNCHTSTSEIIYNFVDLNIFVRRLLYDSSEPNFNWCSMLTESTYLNVNSCYMNEKSSVDSSQWTPIT